MRSLKKELAIFKKFEWTVVYPIFFPTESYRPAATDCQTLTDHVDLICFKEAVYVLTSMGFPLKKRKSSTIFSVKFLQFKGLITFCMKFKRFT